MALVLTFYCAFWATGLLPAPTLPLWATGLWEEESVLMLLSLRRALLGPRYMGRAFLPGQMFSTLKHSICSIRKWASFESIPSFGRPQTKRKQLQKHTQMSGPRQDGCLHGGGMDPLQQSAPPLNPKQAEARNPNSSPR